MYLLGTLDLLFECLYAAKHAINLFLCLSNIVDGLIHTLDSGGVLSCQQTDTLFQR